MDRRPASSPSRRRRRSCRRCSARCCDGTLVPGFPATRDPLALAGATLYLPTRRACRLARDVFLDVTGDRAPRSCRASSRSATSTRTKSYSRRRRPAARRRGARLAAGARRARAAAAAGAAGPGVGDLARVRRRRATPLIANSPAAALALADDLARLMDDMTTRQVPWERLDELVPDELDDYWQLTLRFLKIAREHGRRSWPSAAGIEPPARRDRLIAAEARAACRQDRRPGDRRRLDRLDAGDRRPDRDHRAPAARRRGAARARHRPRRRLVGSDRRHARRCRAANPPRPRSGIRNSPCRRCCAASASRATRSRCSAPPRRMAASAVCRKRCGRPPPPTAGRAARVARCLRADRPTRSKRWR